MFACFVVGVPSYFDFVLGVQGLVVLFSCSRVCLLRCLVLHNLVCRCWLLGL